MRLIYTCKNSNAPYINTKTIALTGSNPYMKTGTLGNNKPKASRMPKTAPEAPTIGIFIIIYNKPFNDSTVLGATKAQLFNNSFTFTGSYLLAKTY